MSSSLLRHRGLAVALGLLLMALPAGAQVAHESYLKASNTGSVDAFGAAVAISGDTLVVGAYGEDSAATGVGGDQASSGALTSGAAYVFVHDGTAWGQQAYLKASNTGAGDVFGLPVAISGDTLVVGATAEDSDATGVDGDGFNDDASTSGAAYVFVRAAGSWTQQAYLKASEATGGLQFGRSLAISGDTIVVGGFTGNDPGAAWVFVRNGTTWSQQAQLKNPFPFVSFDTFGATVTISGDTIVVGDPSDWSSATGVGGDPLAGGAGFSGAAHVFVRAGSTWTYQAYIKASNTGQGDRFGFSLALSGDTLVVGAPDEDSSATGVDGQGGDGSLDPGAAYVFQRTGRTWAQQAYLKASNTDFFDRFGESVAIDGNTIVVGAFQEDSAATGVYGAEDDDSAEKAGAAYVFTRIGSTWSQQAYVKATNTDAGDIFGEVTAVSGDVLVLGASREASAATGVDGNQADDSAPVAGAAYTLRVGPWIAVGTGLAGVAGVPKLVGMGTLVPGSPVALSLLQAKPVSLATLVLGLSQLGLPVKGGVLVPSPDVLVFGLPTDAAGTLNLGASWPAGIPAGISLWFQEWIVDSAGPSGLSASNGVVVTAP